jgi:hypothetical protein
LTGDGASKYLMTPFPQLVLAEFPASSTLALYSQNAPLNSGGKEVWAEHASGGGIGLATSFSGGNTTALMGDASANVITASSPGAGFFLNTRTTSTDHRLFFANSSTAFGQLGSTDSTSYSGTFIGVALPLFACNNCGGSGGIFQWSDNTLSWLSLHDVGLSSGDAQNLFNDVQQYRIDSGGGYTPLTFGPTNSVVLTGNNRTLVVNASALTSPTYQWKKNGTAIGGANASTYTINNAQAADFANYSVDVTSGGSTYTTSAELYVVTTTTVSNWVNCCYMNGSGFVSSNTVWSQDQYWNSTVAHGLDSKYDLVNSIVPDTWIASRTPLLSTVGYSAWTTGLASTSLSSSGITGDSSHHLDTGYNPVTQSLPANSCTFIAYIVNQTGSAGVEFGNWNGGSGITELAVDFAGACYVVVTSIESYIGPVTPPGNGYFCGSRTSSSLLTAYFANSTHSHASFGTAVGTITIGHPNLNVWVCSRNPDFPCNDTVSFAAIGNAGFSSSDSANAYSDIQTLRQNLGGGFQ